ncbi:M23 family metallopeptidase [Notoacmeibacter sp. MSK16QG-6]|uniref:M23 family metallopeptidase n=1 Tax=Notoacmeibacter sp. MSK16QG-6 TaxID=2957982 RepID=UPI0020A14120|nr:M23 family metallopeptidase [Notoacmeibacter sp. MSK16QG-6]MCP1199931.1 M23 family metallopeptidase [Notoacmeibacter sp. MSK16QG-6]
MKGQRELITWLGDQPPIRGDGSASVRDRREISARWLSGTVLTGMTSCVLMGVALFGAMDGREILATPPELWSGDDGSDNASVTRMHRLLPPPPPRAPVSDKRIEVATLQRENKTDVVRMASFAYADLRLAANYSRSTNYPPFDPMKMFAVAKMKSESEPTGEIYGAKIENAVTLRLSDFPLNGESYDTDAELSVEEVENLVRDTGGLLVAEGETQIAALPFVNPQRFGEADPISAMLGAIPDNARIVPENVSIAYQDNLGRPSFSESVLTAKEETNLQAFMTKAGYDDANAKGMVEAIQTLLRGDTLKAGSIMRIGLEENNSNSRIVRTSLYDGREHILTVALDDRGQYVPAEEPSATPTLELAYADQEDGLAKAPAILPTRATLPDAYDAIWQATAGEGLSRDMTQELLRVLSGDVDFQAPIKPNDRIAVLYSHPDSEGEATPDSILLHAKIALNGTEREFYRFTTSEGETDFFDAEGRSARQFLIRNPCPGGRFRSGFGMRRHPILGYSRLHSGVDWAAPRGTPIIASGNGVIEKAGWAGGYGRQTVIRHANGYKTSYNHQSAIAKGVKKGVRVTQGQIIGYVGSTGLSTGNHLHYEVSVNGSKVDPMRVRLPNGLTLSDEELARFQTEKSRIDAILRQREAQQIAAVD